MDAQPRPAVSRLRSSTDPTRPEATTATNRPMTAGDSVSAGRDRPSHIRSKSFLTPTETKARNAITRPTASALEKTAEKLPRIIHLPGSSHRHHHHHHSHSHSHSPLHRKDETALHKRHRLTQSDVQAQSTTTMTSTSRRQQPKEVMSNLPHLVAGLNAEREKRMQAAAPSSSRTAAQQQQQQQTQSQSQHAFGPSGTTSSDYNEGGRYDPQQVRVTTASDSPRPKTSLELTLERADEIRIARRLHVKKEDIIKRDAELAAAEEEMRARIASITAKGVEITRRLDYGYYNLLETVGSLVAIITSFQSLSRQSEQLITNFDKETRRLDADTRKRVEAFKTGFETRSQKADALAERGHRASAKAEDLSTRLENARLIVQNWERREDQVKKVWGRVFGVVWWTTIAVVVLVVAVVLGKEWWFHGDPVKAGLGAHSEGSWNRSLRLGGTRRDSVAMQNQRILLEPPRQEGEGAVAGQPRVPDDVARLLLEIADKNRRRKVVFPAIPKEILAGSDEAEECVDTRHPLKGSKTRRTFPFPFSFLARGKWDGRGLRDQGDEDPRLKMLDEL